MFLMNQFYRGEWFFYCPKVCILRLPGLGSHRSQTDRLNLFCSCWWLIRMLQLVLLADTLGSKAWPKYKGTATAKDAGADEAVDASQ